jgi:hypothetical protein
MASWIVWTRANGAKIEVPAANVATVSVRNKELTFEGPGGQVAWFNLDHIVGYKMDGKTDTYPVRLQGPNGLEEVKVDGSTPPKVETIDGTKFLDFRGTNDKQPVARFVLDSVVGHGNIGPSGVRSRL